MRLPAEDVPQREPVDVSQSEGTSSGILDEDDLATVGEALVGSMRASGPSL